MIALSQFSKNQKLSLKKFFNTISRLGRSFIIDKDIRRFIRHNKKVWYGWGNKQCDSVILVDFYGVGETIISYSYLLNILARKHNARIMTFAPPRKMLLYALHQIYKSFNITGHIVTRLNKEQKYRQQAISQEFIPRLHTKQDIFDLKVLGVWIGIDIYESYLKEYNIPTVYLDDPRLFKMVEAGIGLVIFWQDFFANHKVAAVVISHDCYLHLNVVCKIAYEARVPVYIPYGVGVAYANRPFSVFSVFENYRQMFKNLSPEQQKSAIVLAKKQLERRLSGEIGVDMHCATKSAFRAPDNKKRVLKESKNIKVLICTHCFYDNPHGFGGMLFLDFYEWLKYLGRISERTNYDWYLKTHPDPLPGTLEIIREILAEFPKIKLISPETSFHQLAREGLNFALTIFGSIGEECPALGIQVINAGYNCHVAYDFNWHSKSLEEYEYYLMNLEKLHKNINLGELYEYYYMYYHYTHVDDLFFKSYRQFSSNLTKADRVGSRVYSYFLNQLSEARHQEIISKIQNFIDSGKHHYFIHGPE